MMRIALVRWCSSLALLCGAAALGAAQTTPSPAPSRDGSIRVMTYNIRYGSAPDGPNRWENRRDALVAAIHAASPDLLGTQETLGFQRDFLAEKLPDYAVLGVGRDDGKESGEMMALYYRTDRFEPLDHGHFWLSPTPDAPGSKGWDAALPRMATWVLLRDRSAPDARPILFVNTHFDHRGPEARLQSARLLRRRLAELGANNSIVLTGDFNAGENSPPYRALFGGPDSNDAGPSPVQDVYRLAHPTAAADENTFSGFTARPSPGARIDWIAASPDWTVLSAVIDRTQHDGRTPSDHFAVIADLKR